MAASSSSWTSTLIAEYQAHSLPGMPPFTNPFVQVLPIHTFFQFLLANVYVGVFYYAIYVGGGSLLWWLNPIPKTEKRKDLAMRQLKMGLVSLFSLILYTTLWLWLADKHTPYYGYWAERQDKFDLTEAIIQIFIYMFVFDTWFYATHHFLHIQWFMQHVHRHHHQWIQPTAFAQDAVHPFQSVLQGPMGHFLCTLVYPMNPMLISILGFLSSIYALLAHDGRALDLNDHTKHHFYRTCNYGLYWGFWDYVFGTRYSKEKYPARYVPTWELQAQQSSRESQGQRQHLNEERKSANQSRSQKSKKSEKPNEPREPREPNKPREPNEPNQVKSQKSNKGSQSPPQQEKTTKKSSKKQDKAD